MCERRNWSYLGGDNDSNIVCYTDDFLLAYIINYGHY